MPLTHLKPNMAKYIAMIKIEKIAKTSSAKTCDSSIQKIGSTCLTIWHQIIWLTWPIRKCLEWGVDFGPLDTMGAIHSFTVIRTLEVHLKCWIGDCTVLLVLSKIKPHADHVGLLGKGPSINYVVSKSAIFDHLPPCLFLISRFYLVKRLWGYPFLSRRHSLWQN